MYAIGISRRHRRELRTACPTAILVSLASRPIRRYPAVELLYQGDRFVLPYPRSGFLYFVLRYKGQRRSRDPFGTAHEVAGSGGKFLAGTGSHEHAGSGSGRGSGHLCSPGPDRAQAYRIAMFG